MKQISKTAEVLAKLRASYGADANLDDLAVYEVILANTQPLRKTGGLFKGARLASTLITEIVSAVNLESVPVQFQHDTSTAPYGRLFAAAASGDEARGLLAVDGKAHPEVVQKLDSGTIDQVSVGMVNKQLLCSQCGFDYANEKSYPNRWDLTCDKEHKIGDAGTHVQVVGLESLFEVSFVGQGAVRGARVVGPSESAFQDNQRLAASSAATGGALAVHLTATVEDDTPMDLSALTTQLTTAVSDGATARANLAMITTERDGLATNLATVTGERDTAITERNTAQTDLATATETVTTLTAAHEAAITALSAEAKAVLTACGKSEADIETELKDKDATALLGIIQANRSQFAAIIPAGGAANSADLASTSKIAPRRTNAFRSPARA
jgi:hypothetical protein